MPMPNRQMVGGELYRYSFQGQEKDPETGKEAFQLRLWDGRIGRWLTTDPAGQYASPYLGMGNNPINGVDPDGALFGWVRAQWQKLWNGGSVVKNDFDQWTWSSDTTLSGNLTNGLVSSEMEMKNFGYGGFGKFTRKSTEVFLNGRVDVGPLNLGLDVGLLGATIKGSTTDILNFNLGGKKEYGNKWKWNNSMKAHVEEDKPKTGILFGIDLETLYGDYGYNKTYMIPANSQLSSRLQNNEHNAYAGYMVLRLHGLNINKKGVGISLNL